MIDWSFWDGTIEEYFQLRKVEVEEKPMTVEELELQAIYFKTRDQMNLRECKDAERRLHVACVQILNPPKPITPNLFGDQ
jgi:hypothetical protein